MGICVSIPEGDRILRRKNDQIEQQLKKDEEAAQREVKMLLLGAGESGKSTILKQMKLIHEGGYSEREKRNFKGIINSNIIVSMKTILSAMQSLNIPLGDPANESNKALVMSASEKNDPEPFAPALASALKELWADSGVQAAYMRNGTDYHLNDSAKYYLDSIDRIAQPTYDPSDQDILRSRVKTTGIMETVFEVEKLTYRMFDVGGQRSERKKWISCFNNVQAIVFLVAISEYDEKLVEDESVNRMQEAFTLFDSIANSRWFKKTAIILFLNKIDIFEEKIERVPIEDYFEDYEGGPILEEGVSYFKERFQALTSEDKQIFMHTTCATDTGQVRVVMQSVQRIIIDACLKQLDMA